jgi:hypothetical protein
MGYRALNLCFLGGAIASISIVSSLPLIPLDLAKSLLRNERNIIYLGEKGLCISPYDEVIHESHVSYGLNSGLGPLASLTVKQNKPRGD